MFDSRFRLDHRLRENIELQGNSREVCFASTQMSKSSTILNHIEVGPKIFLQRVEILSFNGFPWFNLELRPISL